MKLSPLVIGIFGISSCSLIHASALDQSGQSILPFLETGHYAEVSIASV
ncbi:MAG: transporter, partial [Acinetobacter sp.]